MLICGHSYVFWVAHCAQRMSLGSQLGLSQWAIVDWMGRRGLQWPGLLSLLFTEHKGPVPDVLVIHLGRTDLGLVGGKALVMQVFEDLLLIRTVAWGEDFVVRYSSM